MAAPDRLYFRQILAGMDVAEDDPIAQQMVNFVYLIGDRETGEAVAVDLAYDIPGVLDVLAADGMRLVGTLATHYHPDHVGGSLMGHPISGIADLLEREQVPVHVQSEEVEWVTRSTGVGVDHLVAHASGDTVMVGEIPITLIHTPGHTPGSQCFLVDGRLISGDTLFIGSCGRTDLPGSDPSEMYYSLTQRLGALPDDTVLFPGHNYGGESSTIGDEKRGNPFMRFPSLGDFLGVMGRKIKS
jgi:hydroxyacylglutathione hydrolase